MSQADGYIRIVTKNDVSEAEKSTEQLGDTIAEAMDTAPVDQMKKAFDGLGDAVSNTNTSGVDDLKDSLNGVGSAAVSTGDLIKANLISDVVMQGVQKLSESLKDAAVYAVGTADGLDKAVGNISAATGAGVENAAALEKTVKEIYSENLGEGYEDIAKSVSVVKQNIRDLNDVDLGDITEKALMLDDVFGYGVEESSRAAKAMMKSFGVSAAEAYDYIAKGAQDGLDYSGELLDSISEYSSQYKKMGLSVSDMFNSFKAGAESGAWNIDKIGDAYKELSIRVVDGSDTTAEGFAKIGLNADEMATKFAAGGETARQAYTETMNALIDLQDPIAQDAAGVALMGTMWEDLGKDAVASLVDITENAYAASGAMDSIKETNYSALSDHLGELRRKIDLFIEPIGEEIIPAIDKVSDKIEDVIESGDVQEKAEDVGEFISGTLVLLIEHIDLAASAISGVTAAVITFKTVSVLTKVIAGWQTAALQVTLFSQAQGAAALKTAALNGTLTTQELIYAVLSGKLDIATVKQYALNTAMSLNPAGLVAAAVGLLATALVGYSLYAKEATDETEKYNKTLDDIKNKQDDAIAQSEAELALLEKKVSRYEELRMQTSKNADQTAELTYLAEDLQKVFGDSVDVVDSLTGKYNSLTDAYDDYAATLIRNVLVEAKQNSALEAQKSILEWEKQIADLETQKSEYINFSGIGADSDEASEAPDYDDDGEEIHLINESVINRLEKEQEQLRSYIEDAQAIIDDYINAASVNGTKSAISETSAAGYGDYSSVNHLPNYYATLAEEYDYWSKAYKHDYDMGLLSAAEYYEKLARLRDEYLAPDSDEWRSVSVELKKYYDSLSVEQQKAIDEAAKARTSAYNDEKSQLQFRLKTNQITEKQYYTELAKIRDKYLDKNSSEWRSAYLEAYQYNQQLLQTNKDALTQLLSDASDTTLSALENITAARDSLSSKLMNFNKTFEKIKETVPETIAVKGNFTITTAEHEIETYRMGADSIEDNIKVLEEYGAMLDALKARGADESALNDILAMDVDEALEFGGKLLNMSDKEWNAYFDSMAKLRQTAADISAKYYQNEVESLRDNFIDKLRSELDGLGADMYNVGADVAAEFVSGWNEALGTKDLTIGELMRAVSVGTLDTAPKAAQQLVSAGNAKADADNTKTEAQKIITVPIYIGTKKIAEVMVDATNGEIIRTGKNVLLT